MRISGWSSDVCSSGLAQALDGILEGRRVLLGQLAVHRRVRQHHRVLLGGASLVVEQLAVHEIPVGAEPRVGAVLRQLLIAGIERSEEHTSELQSLMRISYAVFCLKKKII